jgi:hypothetical protein
MIKVKTSEATGLQLDWGLLGAANKYPRRFGCHIVEPYGDSYRVYSHADPVVCMGLIGHGYGVVKNLIAAACPNTAKRFYHASGHAKEFGRIVCAVGDTPAEAVARCVISMRLGETFECPDSLFGEEK